MNESTNTMENGPAPLHIALIGASGAMGEEIERLAPKENLQIALRFDSRNPLPEACPDTEFDAAIDFTLPDVAPGNIRRVLEWDKPIVVGTTGWLDALPDVEALVRERNGRVVWGSNFSVGVQAFFRIVRRAAELFDRLEGYDAALHEEHHVRKADSPSGTARSIAGILLDALERKSRILAETSHGRIDPDALHVTSRRVGATVGTHIVTFDAEADTIELTHRAKNRSGFALGAIAAARWLAAAPSGLYRFDDLFEEIILGIGNDE